MVIGVLPEDGPAQVGPVTLPPGRRQFASENGQPVAWSTIEPMSTAGLVWHALSAVSADTGLTPVLLEPASPSPETTEPYFGFYLPVDVALLDQVSPAGLLAANWSAICGSPGTAIYRAPFGDQFPGLAPPESEPLPATELERALAALPPAYLGVVSARRPAEVPAVVGWSVFGNDFDPAEENLDRYLYDDDQDDDTPEEIYPPGVRSLQIGVMLRSWESRFGARLLRIGGDAILQVLVERPPRTVAAARRVAAEHRAFADEIPGTEDTVTSIADHIIGAPIWQFWWD